ncbi:MAG: MarR family transcriptional regulator [Rhodothermaceae bacterium]|nr:MarR family transcriptional regulator [Rhodothermaceae bacterium]
MLRERSVHATARRLSDLYDPILGRLGVRKQEYLVLALLWEYDGMTVSRLCMRLHVTEAMMEPQLRAMEQVALVERDRTAKPHDVWLTRRGRALQAQAPRVPSALLCHVLFWLDHEAEQATNGWSNGREDSLESVEDAGSE